VQIPFTSTKSKRNFYTQVACQSFHTAWTHSCTSPLDLVALLLDIESRDELILPSYTFVSTAKAFVLRGAVPVFVDTRARRRKTRRDSNRPWMKVQGQVNQIKVGDGTYRSRTTS
jgi:dTDP-4-amino-4,6-dideoxygalactose transaminase